MPTSTLETPDTPHEDIQLLAENPATTATATTRVLHIVNGEHYAGAERVQDLAALRLPEFGYEVGFVCLKSGRFSEVRKAQSAPLVTLPMGSQLDVRPAIAVANLLRREKYSLIHTHTPRAALIGRLASLLTGLPMVHHVHSPTIADTTHRVKRWLNGVSERVTMNHCSALITVSHTLREYVARRGLKARTIRTVHNGVPVQGPLSIRPTPNNTWTLGTVALFRPRKGLEVLLDALAELRKQNYPVRLRAVGQFETADYERTIRQQVDRLELNDAIDWTGFTRDVSSELALMDVFVLPSLFGEGLPMVVLEAMAAGVPVVATRVEGIPEAIQHGADGLIVEPNNPSALAAEITRLVTGDVSWSQLRTNAHRRHEEQFSDVAMAAGIANVYREVLTASLARRG